MARSKAELLDEYQGFRRSVRGFQKGSNQPDQQLRAIYDQWIKESAEWEDARAAFSLYCRLNRLLNSDFVNHLFEFAGENEIVLSGEGAEFRIKDTVEVIGTWLLSGLFPSKVDLQYATKRGRSGTVHLIIIKRADDGRYELYNLPEEEVTEALKSLFSSETSEFRLSI